MISPDNILNARILIVDDMVANVRLLEGMLRVEGYTSVESTSNPKEVCDLQLKNHYDLILLDLLMPAMDGFKVMEGLKAIEEGGYLPVLVITAQPNHKLRALSAGARDFVSKPFELAEVLVRVRNMLEVRLLHRESKDYAKALEQKVQEVEASRDLISRQSEEVKRLYDEIVAEQKRSFELTAVPGAMVGVETEERLTTPWLRSLRLRHPWLHVNLFTAFLAAAVVYLFQGTINRLLILTVFLPVLASQSVNTGSQALAVTLRGIVLGDLEPSREKALLRKEAFLGLMNGVFVGLTAAVGMYIVALLQHSPDAFMLSVVVFIAMIGSCIISSISGTFVPLILKRFGADPVVASSIFLTTVTDVVSMGMLLALAKVLVR